MRGGNGKRIGVELRYLGCIGGLTMEGAIGAKGVNRGIVQGG